MNETKKHILKITFSLFLKKNFKEVTMKEIVEKTGLSKGAFYHYFESKEQLFGEVINFFFSSMVKGNIERERAETLREYYLAGADLINQSLPEILSEDQAPHDIFNLNFFSLMFDALKIIPGFKEKMQEHHSAEREQWCNKIAKARHHGEIYSPLSDDQIASLFIYSADGLMLNKTLYGANNELKEELLDNWNAIYLMIRR